MTITLDQPELDLVTYCLREMLYRRLTEAAVAPTHEKRQGYLSEVERLKSLLTRLKEK